MDEAKSDVAGEVKPEGKAKAQPKLTKAQQKALKKPVKTANGKIIRDLMLANRVKGNYKDFVIIAGDRLMDWAGSYDMLNDGKKVIAQAVALIHKSKLANVIGAEPARAFWRPTLGRVNTNKPMVKK